MSPTYWTASRIKMAARAHGWEIVPSTSPGMVPNKVWGCRKDRHLVQIKERRDGGLSWVSLRYPKYGGANCDYYGPRAGGKLKTVLDFLCDCGMSCKAEL
jgi:hypothetical protein